MWSNLAAAQGLELAAKNRGIVAERMTPAKIMEAQHLARASLEAYPARPHYSGAARARAARIWAGLPEEPRCPLRWYDFHEFGCHPGNVGSFFGLGSKVGYHCFSDEAKLLDRFVWVARWQEDEMTHA